jgi:arginyl-tRNA synthetase
MSLLDDLSDSFGAAFAAVGLDHHLGEVVVSARPDLAQFQCNGALPAARVAGRNSREIAADVVAALAGTDRFTSVEVAGPGFINIVLTDAYLASRVDAVVGDDRLGAPEVGDPDTVVVDYGGPNVAKELHVGHLRPAIIGESIKRMFRHAGHTTYGDVHLGDWGTPMGQLIVELEERKPGLPYFDPIHTGAYPSRSPVTVADLQEMYPVASAKAAEDLVFAERARQATMELQAGRAGYMALWRHFRDVSVEALRAVYDRLGVEFDLWLGESDVHERIEPMVARLLASGVAIMSDGAVVVEVAEENDTKEIPPLLLVKSDGAYLYSTTDLATIEDRVETLGADVMVYTVDVRQGLHFEQVYRAARKAGIAGPDVVLDHAGNGTVNGPDGKPFKTREGGLLRLKDLIAMVVERAWDRLDENDLAVGYDEEERAEIARMVGLAALKFGDLHNHRTSDYVFDIERFTSFEGKTGPYLLYGTVRIRSILRKAAAAGLAPGPIVPATADAERALMLRLLRLPEVLGRALEVRAPNHLAEHAYDLVTDFSRFYEACHILREPDAARQASWLALVDVTLRQVLVLLDLLGIESPERM